MVLCDDFLPPGQEAPPTDVIARTGEDPGLDDCDSAETLVSGCFPEVVIERFAIDAGLDPENQHSFDMTGILDWAQIYRLQAHSGDNFGHPGFCIGTVANQGN